MEKTNLIQILFLLLFLQVICCETLRNKFVEVRFSPSNQLISFSTLLSDENHSFVPSDKELCVFQAIVVSSTSNYTIGCTNSSFISQQRLSDEILLLRWENISIENALISFSVNISVPTNSPLS